MSHQVISIINPPSQVSRISSTRSFKPPNDAEVVSGTIELKMFVNENKIELKMCPLVDAFFFFFFISVLTLTDMHEY